MPIAPWEDLDLFLDPVNGFAVQVQIIPTAGPVRTPIKVIFDETGVNAALGAQFVRDDTAPRIWGKESDLASAIRGDRVTMGARTFDVMDAPEPDGTGWASLRLRAQAGSSGR